MRRRVHLLAALGVGEDLGSVLKVREGLAAEVLLAAVVAHVQRHVGEDLDQRGLGREVAAVHAAADEGRLAAARGAEQLGVLVDVQLAQVALALQELDGLAQGVRIARVAQRGEALGLEEVQVAPAAAAAAAASFSCRRRVMASMERVATSPLSPSRFMKLLASLGEASCTRSWSAGLGPRFGRWGARKKIVSLGARRVEMLVSRER